jgi:hypothetical protein
VPAGRELRHRLTVEDAEVEGRAVLGELVGDLIVPGVVHRRQDRFEVNAGLAHVLIGNLEKELCPISGVPDHGERRLLAGRRGHKRDAKKPAESEGDHATLQLGSSNECWSYPCGAAMIKRCAPPSAQGPARRLSSSAAAEEGRFPLFRGGSAAAGDVDDRAGRVRGFVGQEPEDCPRDLLGGVAIKMFTR